LLEIHFGNYLFCPCQKVELAKKWNFEILSRYCWKYILDMFGNVSFCPSQKFAKCTKSAKVRVKVDEIETFLEMITIRSCS
jgi:hypothetical protein